MNLLAFFREGPDRWVNWYSDPDGATWVERVFRLDPRVAGRAWFAVPYDQSGGVTDADMRRLWPTWPYPRPLTDAQALGLLDLVRGRCADPVPPTSTAAAFAAEGLDCVFVRRAARATLDTAWLSTDVRGLARGIRQGAHWDRMPILADALQDAGCEADGVLAHCRGSGPHVLDCWVVDLVLGEV